MVITFHMDESEIHTAVEEYIRRAGHDVDIHSVAGGSVDVETGTTTEGGSLFSRILAAIFPRKSKLGIRALHVR